MANTSNGSSRPRRGPSQAVRERMRDGALVAALTGSLNQAGPLLGLRKTTLYCDAQRHPELFESLSRWARNLMAKAGMIPDDGKRILPSIEKRIAVGAVLHAYGLSQANAARAMNLYPEALENDSRRHPGVWKRHYDTARALITRPACTDAGEEKMQETEASRLIQAATIEAVGESRSRTARFLGVSRSTLDCSIQRHRPFYEKHRELAKAVMYHLGVREDAAKRHFGPRPETRDKMLQCAALLRDGYSPTEASKKAFGRRGDLYEVMNSHRDEWAEIAKAAGIPVDARGVRPRLMIRMRMKRLALIYVSGLSKAEASRRLGLPERACSDYARRYPKYWSQAVRDAREQLGIPRGVVQTVRMRDKQTGKLIPRTQAHGPGFNRIAKAKPNTARRRKSGRPGGRKPSPARAIVLDEMHKNPQISRQKLANIVNQKCARAIGHGKMKKMTAAGLRNLIKRLRQGGQLA